MSHAALTARYRPQTFAEVAGQETLRAILSRASLEGKVAPAYLFSGTRGVGKTTLARIFAKALNCRTAPTAEPCNTCDQCRAVAQGNAVDVVEIDGASNRGIDDVRRLKEVVGYAPMEGRYKVFIIDEAHMLSREAFNALLKTLEEPPQRVTFILATTEPHKFPATIISRCQHYVFKRLPENALADHLAGVLRREGVECEESAVRLLARRGAGSVRDSMSMLSQVLALGAGAVTRESVRGVLGLAGQEAFVRLLEAFRDGDSLALARLVRELLDQGLDMGFFLRELASIWRTLFLLRQSGEAALAVTDLPEDEARGLLALAGEFSLAHIHACWQMTLEGQRRVLTSLEPALALELLLLNLGMLPRLLSLEQLSVLGRRGGQSSGATGGNAPASGGVPQGGTPVSGHGTGRGAAPSTRGAASSEAPARGTGTRGGSSASPGKPLGAPVLEETAPVFSKDIPAEDVSESSTFVQEAPAPPFQATPVPGAPETPISVTLEPAVPTVPEQPAPFSEPRAELKLAASQPSAFTPVAEPETFALAPYTPDSPALKSSEAEAEDANFATPQASLGSESLEAGAMYEEGEASSSSVLSSAPFATSDPSDNEARASSPPWLTEAEGDEEEEAREFFEGGALFETPPGQVAVSPSLAARLSEPSEGNSKHPASLTNAASPASVGGALSPQGPFPDWAAIVEQVTRAEGPPWFSALARKVRADWKDGQLRLFPGDGFTAQRLREPSVKTVLDTSLAALGCAGALVEVCSPEKAPDSRATLRKEILDNPLVQLVEKTFDARIIDHGQLR